MIPDRLYYRLQPRWARFWTRYLARAVLVHINKTGGTSVEKALGMPFQHRTALELIELMGPRRWEDAFTFTFVRNPWDKVASHYRYRIKTNQTGLGVDPIPFTDWVRRAYGDRDPRYFDQPRMFMPQSHWVCDEHGALLVDFVGRFEQLEDDFAEVCRRLGQRAELPHLKSSSAGRDYRDLYDAESVEIVRDRFAEDLERFGYSFEQA